MDRVTVGNGPGGGLCRGPDWAACSQDSPVLGGLQGCVLLLALFPGTFEVQQILVGGGLMNARL